MLVAVQVVGFTAISRGSLVGGKKGCGLLSVLLACFFASVKCDQTSVREAASRRPKSVMSKNARSKNEWNVSRGCLLRTPNVVCAFFAGSKNNHRFPERRKQSPIQSPISVLIGWNMVGRSLCSTRANISRVLALWIFAAASHTLLANCFGQGRLQTEGLFSPRRWFRHKSRLRVILARALEI